MKDPTDSLDALLVFFENALTLDVVDFVSSLPSEDTEKVMKEVVTCVGRDNWRVLTASSTS